MSPKQYLYSKFIYLSIVLCPSGMAAAQLSFQFYEKSCLLVLSIINLDVQDAVSNELTRGHPCSVSIFMTALVELLLSLFIFLCLYWSLSLHYLIAIIIFFGIFHIKLSLTWQNSLRVWNP